jgi:hypothetical protein
LNDPLTGPTNKKARSQNPAAQRSSAVSESLLIARNLGQALRDGASILRGLIR